MRNSTKKITAIAAALLLSVSGVATTAAMAAPAVFAAEVGDSILVTFDTDGGSSVPSQKITLTDTTSGDAVKTPTTPTKPGYTFAGWVTEAGVAVDFATTQKVKVDTTYYATWTADVDLSLDSVEYTIGQTTLNVEMSKALTSGLYVVQVTYGGHTYTTKNVAATSATLSDIKAFTTTADYVDGKLGSAATFTPTTPENGDKITVAVYKQATTATQASTYDNAMLNATLVGKKEITVDSWYTVTLNPNGGTSATDKTSLRIKANSAITTIASDYNPTRTGYDFVGWYTDAACTKAVNLSKKVTADTTLYAKWKAFNTVNTVTKIGYAATAANATKASGETVSQDNTFYAKLESAVGSQQYLIEVKVNGQTYSKVYTGDNSSVNALYISLANGGAYDFVGTEKGAAATFSSTNAPTLNDGDTATVTVYSFTIGTYTKGTTTYAEVAAAGLTAIKSETVTIKKNYTVTFDTQGGSTVAANSVAAGLKATQPNDPTKEGYDFTGWYTDAACTTAYDFDTVVPADTTLYAGWKMSANNIAGATIATIANVAYTGEAQTPALKVTLGDKELVEGTDYTVEYTNNTEVGCATATITGIGAYTGTNARNFVIVPQQVTGLKAVKKTATTLKLQFNAVEGADGYKIYDAETGKAIASVSTQNGADVLKKTITGLNAGETRKYKVRAYKIVNGTKRYAEYSAVYTKATAKK